MKDALEIRGAFLSELGQDVLYIGGIGSGICPLDTFGVGGFERVCVLHELPERGAGSFCSLSNVA